MPALTQLLLRESSDLAKQFVLVSFFFLAALMLGLDSQPLAQLDIEGQRWVDLCAIAYFGLLLLALRPDQRLMALIFVPFSAVGEYVFSLLFGLYHYRLGEVPLYVPFGHAILFSVGLLIANLSLVRQYEEQLRPTLISAYVILFSTVIVLFHDSLSAIFGLVFLWVLRRKGYQTLYFIMGLLVLYIELMGTAWGCWVWTVHPFGLDWLQATNPPFGAFVCYVLADLGVIKIARYFSPKLGIELLRGGGVRGSMGQKSVDRVVLND